MRGEECQIETMTAILMVNEELDQSPTTKLVGITLMQGALRMMADMDL